MIRSLAPDDTTALIALAQATGLFDPDQTEELAQMLDGHLAGEAENQDLWLVDDENGIVGVAYVASERMTEGTWNLYLIAVHPNHQRQGRGRALLRHVEQILSECGARMLLVETSGLESFEYVRAFYRTCGYDEEARIRDFYKAGDDKIVYRKVIASPSFQRGMSVVSVKLNSET